METFIPASTVWHVIATLLGEQSFVMKTKDVQLRRNSIPIQSGSFIFLHFWSDVNGVFARE